MANNIYGAINLIDSTGSLDTINGALLQQGDVAFVVTDTNTYFYKLFDNDTSVENSPYVIIPNINANNKRWKLTSINETSGDFRVAGDLIINKLTGASYTIESNGVVFATVDHNGITFNGFKTTSTTLVENLNAALVGGLAAEDIIAKDGSVSFTGAVGGVTPTMDAHLATKGYVDDVFDSVAGDVKKDGSVSFTAPIGGQDPIDSTDLSTKNYVDNEINGLQSYVNSYVGTAGYMTVSPSGTYEYPFTQWEDLRFPVQGINPAGSSAPPSVDNTTGLLDFSATVVNTIAGIAQMPHSWDEGSAIIPHIHWTTPDTNAGNVVWRFEYQIADKNGMFPGSYTALPDVIAPASGVTLKHVSSSFASIDMTGYHISCIIMWKLSRIGNDGTNDTYGSVAKLLEFDIHYQQNSLGSGATSSR